MSCKCPKCGAALQITMADTFNVEKIEPVRPSKLTKVTTPRPPKFRTGSDVGRLRSALYKAGFEHQSSGTIFNDAREYGRRLKLYFAGNLFTNRTRYDTLIDMIGEEFGDRFLGATQHKSEFAWEAMVSFVIKLSD